MCKEMAWTFITAAFILLLVGADCEVERELVLALEDNFDDFNLSLWKHELTLGGGGNWEFQWYANNRSNSYVEGGVLNIEPTLLSDIIGEDAVRAYHRLEIWGASPADLCTGNAFYGCERQSGPNGGGNYLNPIVSARIRTAESFSFTYGKVEVRAKLPRGDWLWPAIWMLPRDNQYGQWPASGEIDIMESRGNPPSYSPGGRDKFGSTLHWGPYYTENGFDLTHAEATSEEGDFSADFHTYGLIWNETYIGTYVDSEENTVLAVDTSNQTFWSRGGWEGSTWANPWRGRGPNAPFDRQFYLIINLAVGGTTGFFPDGYGKPWENSGAHAVNTFYDDKGNWSTTWTQNFQVDSVRVWSYTPTPVPPDTSSSSIFTSLFQAPSPTAIASAVIGSLVAVFHVLSLHVGTVVVCLILFGIIFQLV